MVVLGGVNMHGTSRSDSRCNQCLAAGLADSTAEPLYDLYGGKPKMSTKTLPHSDSDSF